MSETLNYKDAADDEEVEADGINRALQEMDPITDTVNKGKEKFFSPTPLDNISSQDFETAIISASTLLTEISEVLQAFGTSDEWIDIYESVPNFTANLRLLIGSWA